MRVFMKATLLLGTLLTLFATSTFASVVKGYDKESGCDLYRVIQKDATGKIKNKQKSGEVIIYAKEVYGLSFQEMEINFDNREVLIQPTMNVILGINRPLTSAKVVLSSEREDFNFLINQLNRKVSLFEKICINDGKIVYAKVFEAKP